MRVTMPSWHEDARKLRDQGLPLIQIVEMLKDQGVEVTASRVSQVTSEGWQQRAELDRVKLAAREQELKSAKKEGRLPDTKAAVRHAVFEWRKSQVQRQFELVPATDPTDVYHRLRIRCSEPECRNTLIFTRRGAINPTQASRWFADKGWIVGNSERKDLCPDHQRKPAIKGDAEPAKMSVNIPIDRGLEPPKKFPDPVRQIRRPKDGDEPSAALPKLQQANEQRQRDDFNKLQQRKDGPDEQPPLPKPVKQEVRTPTRTDKRLIHLKLEEVYADEEIGYKEGWTDERVAADLQFPLEWISAVREDSFGPATPGLTKIISGIEEKAALLEAEMVHIEAMVRQSEDLWEKLDAKLDAYDAGKAELKAMLIEFNRRNSQ